MKDLFFKYKNFKAADFFQDEEFVESVLTNDNKDNVVWSELRYAYPHLQREMDDAIAWIALLKKQPIYLGNSSPEARWNGIQQQIPAYTRREERRIVTRRIGRWSFYIAAILLAALVLYDFSQFGTKTGQTGFAQRKTIALPDESIIELNSNSKVSYTRGWKSDKPREVWMSGEAMFEIKHTAVRNRLQENDLFVVHVDNLSLTVLGTKFNVKQRRDKIEVTLLRGSLQLTNEDGLNRILRPGETFIYTKGERRQEITKSSDLNKVASWTRGELNIEHTNLSNIIELLEDNYGYEVVLRDSSLLKKRLTGTIPIKNIDDILFVVKHTLDANIQLNNKQIIINSNHN